MDIRPTRIPEVKVIVPARYGDHRGFFSEVYNKRALAEAGIELDFVQDNHAYSAAPGTLRGLHFQHPPAAQAKLVRVLRGRIVDVAVDCRIGAPTYGQYVMVELSARAGDQMLMPRGFAHGLLTLEPDTEVAYKVDADFAPSLEGGIRWDDPDIAIPWPTTPDRLVLSDRDRRLPWLRDLPPIFTHP